MSSSLWLVPRDNIPFVKEIQELISKTVPSNFSSKLKERHDFAPHVTLISGIDPSKTYEATGSSPQEWLDSLTLPEFRKESNEVILELDSLEAGDQFLKKLTIKINQSDNLTKLATQIRLQGALNSSDDEATAKRWAEIEYSPHLSLMYADLPKNEVKNKIPLIELQIGFGLGSLFDCCGGTLSQGGQLVLVDTSKPISEWTPIARRETPWVMWRMSRNLI